MRRRIEKFEVEETRDEGAFRRGRTISSSAPHSKGETEASVRQKAHQLANRRRKVGYTLLASITGVVLFAVLLAQFTARVEVQIQDTTNLASVPARGDYEAAVEEYLRSNIGQRFRFATDIDALTAYVQQHYPEVASLVPAGMSGAPVTRYDVRLREPVASWNINDARYYTDARGVIFQNNYYSAPAVRVSDDTGADIDGSIASVRLLNFIGRVVALADEYSVPVEQIVLPPETTRTIDVHTGNTVARMTLDRGAGVQVEDLARVLAHSDGDAPSYIDVRVEGRAFYR